MSLYVVGYEATLISPCMFGHAFILLAQALMRLLATSLDHICSPVILSG